MAVGVDDGHFLDTVGFPQVFDHDGFDVDVAKAAGPLDDPHGVMPRRTDQGKTAFHLFVQDRHADVFAPPALIKCDSVITSHTSGTQKWTVERL